MKQTIGHSRSGAERQKAYRANRQTVSIDITAPTANRIRALRKMHDLTTEQTLAMALTALEAAQAAGDQAQRAAAPKPKVKAQPKPGGIPSPGDDSHGPPAAQTKPPRPPRTAKASAEAKADSIPTPQGRLDL